MKKYEITYLTVGEETPESAMIGPILSEHGAKVTDIHPWGSRRKLAFPIEKQDFAFYTTVVFEADPAIVAPIQRDIHLSADILRAIIVEFEPGIFHRRVEPAEEPGASKPTPTEKTPTPAPAEIVDTTPSPMPVTVKEAVRPDEEGTPKPKRTRTAKKASPSEDKSLDEKLDALLNEDITK